MKLMNFSRSNNGFGTYQHNSQQNFLAAPYLNAGLNIMRLSSLIIGQLSICQFIFTKSAAKYVMKILTKYVMYGCLNKVFSDYNFMLFQQIILLLSRKNQINSLYLFTTRNINCNNLVHFK